MISYTSKSLERHVFCHVFVLMWAFSNQQLVRFGPKVSQIGPKWDTIWNSFMSDFNTFCLSEADLILKSSRFVHFWANLTDSGSNSDGTVKIPCKSEDKTYSLCNYL